MYISSSSIRILALTTLFSTTLAQTIDKLSFGHKQPIGKDDKIPGWKVSGENHDPAIFSDRIILTPPYPGNTRGALWSEERSTSNTWDIEFEFRASGPERGTGNLQLWYTRDEQSAGVASIYTVGQFDGLALVLDQYGGSGGSIRGFLNDGSTNFKGLQSIDPHAFGHCQYAYRNLGRTTKINVRNGNDGLAVLVDGKTCFQSDKVSLPASYHFGISAAAAEHPDSFEVTKFVVSSSSGTGSSQYSPQGQAPGNQQQQQQQQPQGQPQWQQARPPAPAAAASAANQPPPANYDTQFNQLLSAIQNLQNEVRNLKTTVDDISNRQQDVSNRVAQISDVERRTQGIDNTVKQILSDVEGKDYKDNLERLQKSIRDTQQALMTSLPQSLGKVVSASAPQMGFFIFVVLGFQAALAAVYIYYKRRRSNSPKKLL